MVKFCGLLPSLVSLLVLSSPGMAAQVLNSGKMLPRSGSNATQEMGKSPQAVRARREGTLKARTRRLQSESARGVNESDLGTKALAFGVPQKEEETQESSDPQNTQTSDGVAIVESIEIKGNGTQLVLRADGPLTYTSGWASALYYEVKIESAQLAPNVTVPQPPTHSTISRLRVEQIGSEKILIRIRPAPQVQIQANQIAPQMLAVSLQSYSVNPPRNNLPPLENFSDFPREVPRQTDGRIVVVIDPGHGGPDVGAIGIGGLSETDIVNPMSHRIAELLEEQGETVVLTRSDNRDLDLEPRVQLANRLDANLFVSIHANAISMSRPDINGVETYYYNTGGRLAQILHSYLLEASGGPDRGVKTARFYVLRNTSMPAVLLELGFVTGRYDAPRLADLEYQELLSQAIARGILAYIQQYCPGPYCEP